MQGDGKAVSVERGSGLKDGRRKDGKTERQERREDRKTERQEGGKTESPKES